MFLNDEEKRIQGGERGHLARKCMEYLVAYGEAAGAERLVDIDGTVDIHPGSNPCWVPDYVITAEEIETAAKRGEQFKVPTFANKPTPGFIIDGYEGCGTYPTCKAEYHDRRMAQMEPLIRMGMIPTLSCDYYLSSTYWPTAGQHCSWGESSAIPWLNAVLGARGNFDGCFQTAYLGKVPMYDLHLDEKRIASVLVRYDGTLQNDMEYELFGWAASEKLGMKVPAFVNIGRPTVSQLVKMNSTLSTGGQVRMYHIPGVTPEASCVEEAFRGRKPQEEMTVTRADLRRVYDMLNESKNTNVDYVYLGCPHYNIVEVQKVARLINGKRLRAEMWVMTSPAVYELAVKLGYKDTLERAGAKLMSGTCAGEMRGELLPYETMATDSCKQNYYISGHLYPRKIDVWYGTTEDCVRAAISGVWSGEWR